jgi:hypothetical protein
MKPVWRINNNNSRLSNPLYQSHTVKISISTMHTSITGLSSSGSTYANAFLAAVPLSRIVCS